jgi:hypothetical protein
MDKNTNEATPHGEIQPLGPYQRIEATLVSKLNLADFQNAVPMLRELGIVNDAAEAARAHRTTQEDVGIFYWPNGLDPETPVPFRRAAEESARAVDETCMSELAALAREVVAGGRRGEDAVAAMARELGMRRLGAASRGRVERAIHQATILQRFRIRLVTAFFVSNCFLNIYFTRDQLLSNRELLKTLYRFFLLLVLLETLTFPLIILCTIILITL